jgi:hypothetical protein
MLRTGNLFFKIFVFLVAKKNSVSPWFFYFLFSHGGRLHEFSDVGHMSVDGGSGDHGGTHQ